MWLYIAWAATFLAAYLLRDNGDQKVPRLGQDDVRLPTAREGDPIPIIFGQVMVRQPNVIWMGTLQSTPVVQYTKDILGYRFGEVVTGYEYYIPFQMALGIPAYKNCNLLRMVVGERDSGAFVWPNVIGNYSWMIFPTVQQSDMHNALICAFYGGDVNTAGYYDQAFRQVAQDHGFDPNLIPNYKGISLVTFYRGYWKATSGGADSYAFGGSGVGLNELGHYAFVDPGLQAIEPLGHVTIDHFYGTSSISFVNTLPNGWPIGQTASPEPYAFEVICDCSGAIYDGNPSYYLGPVGHGDANPANVLWLAITRSWGMGGIDPTYLDANSFYQAGLTLEAEGHGFSLPLYQVTDLANLIHEIEDQVDGIVYKDTNSGYIRFKLIRNDYNPALSTVFDESNIDDETPPQISTGTFSETYNQVRLTFNSRLDGYTDRVMTAQSLAGINRQGKIRSYDVNFQGIKDYTNAAVVAQRKLKAVSRPLMKVQFKANRDAYNVQVGDVISFNWAEENISNALLRVVDFDAGAPGDERITLDCVEDVFAVDNGAFVIPPQPITRFPTARPVTEFSVEEAPRWALLQAKTLGKVINEEKTHLWYLAVANTNDVTYRGQYSTDGGTTFQDDTGNVNFPNRFLVNATYARTNDPYDTTVGLRIYGVVGTVPGSASSLEISSYGRNLIWVNGEIMSYESATDLGSGIWLLNNVSRGLLDTVPVDHLTNERGYFITVDSGFFFTSWLNTNYIGLAEQAITLPSANINNPLYARVLPYDHTRPLAADAGQPNKTMSVLGRALLPYPVANLRMGQGVASKTPSPVEEEGVDLYWDVRDRTKSTITRGDAAQETPPETTTWTILATKTGLNAYPQQTLANGLPFNGSQVHNSPNVTQQALSKAGHGNLSVAVRSVSANGSSWRDPALDIQALHYRNHLLDPRFALHNGSWTTDSGTPSYSATGGLGNGPYVTSVSDFQMSQVVDVRGYRPNRLTALFNLYAASGLTFTDTIKLTLTALDTSNASLGSVNVTYTPPNALWNYYELAYPNLPTGTAKIKVTVLCHQTSTNLAILWGETCLMVGQIPATGSSYTWLLNQGFETGSTTGWTVGGGTFSTPTTTKYENGTYVQCDTSGTLYQDVTLPTGYDYCTARLRCGRLTATGTGSDTGEVKIQALDGSNNVLATSTTGAETLSSQGVWNRRRLAVDCPAGTTKVRISFVGVHSGTQGKACADDFRLTFHKHLDIDTQIKYDFNNQQIQYLPRTYDEFVYRFPTLPAPDYLVHDFQTASPKYAGISCPMVQDGDVITNAPFVGYWDGTSQINSSVEFNATCNHGEDLHVYGNSNFAHFDGTQAFTFLVFGRFDGDDAYSGSHQILGRFASFGWALSADSTGKLVAECQGIDTGVSVSGTADVKTGEPFWAAISYDPVTKLLHVMDVLGDHTVSAALTGSWKEPARQFRIGRASSGGQGMRGQICRVYAWTSALDYNTQILPMMTHGKEPSNLLYTYTRAGTWMVPAQGDGTVLGSTAWVRASAQGTSQMYPRAYSSTFAAYDGGQWAMPTQAFITNLAPSLDFANATYWRPQGAPTITKYVTGPEGFTNAIKITGTSSDSWEISPVTVASGDITVTWWYNVFGVANMNVQVQLLRSDNTVSDTFSFNTGVARAGWLKKSNTFSWTLPTATCKLRFFASTSSTGQTLGLAPQICITQGANVFQCVPYSRAGTQVSAAGYITRGGSDMVDQHNTEGEIYVEAVAPESNPTVGTLVNLWNATNSNDRRRVRVGSALATGLLFEHYDSAAAVNTATLAVSGWDQTQVIRGRWCRAQVFDASGAYTYLINPSGTVAGRASTWTKTTTPLTRIEIGHANSADIFTGLVRKVVINTREEKQ